MRLSKIMTTFVIMSPSHDKRNHLSIINNSVFALQTKEREQMFV